MRTLFGLLVGLLIWASPGFATSIVGSIDFTRKPAATNAQEAIAGRESYRDFVLRSFLQMPLAPPPAFHTQDNWQFELSMLARMFYRVDLDSVSKNLLTPSFHPWDVGTDIYLLGNACKHFGDYDFILQSLIKMAYLDDESNRTLLSEEARRKLRDVLLSESGTKHHLTFRLENCIPFEVQDTENHILQSEAARYLSNQLKYDDAVRLGEPNAGQFDNSKNGFDEWMAHHLANFLLHDFSEFNSRPYQGYVMIALGNLASYARTPNIKRLASMVLDYLGSKAGVQSANMRRWVPFRRQKDWRTARTVLDYDNGLQWWTSYTGNHRYLDFESAPYEQYEYSGYEYMLLMSSLDTYEPAQPVVENFFESDTPVFQRFHHRDPEIYYQSKSYVISSGGRFRSVWGWGTDQDDAWGVSTVVLPREFGMARDDLFRIDGTKNWYERNNLCVAPDFACGENLHVPAVIPPSCVSKKGNWQFYDLVHCPVVMGFYLAAFTQSHLSTVEVSEPDQTFENFKERVIAVNPKLHLRRRKVSKYVTSHGGEILFKPVPASVSEFPVLSINGVRQESRIEKWPLAFGDEVNQIEPGYMEIRSHSSASKLILDARDPLNSVRTVVGQP